MDNPLKTLVKVGGCRGAAGRSHAVRQQAPQEQGPACLPTAVCPVPGTVPGTKQALEKHLLKEEKK